MSHDVLVTLYRAWYHRGTTVFSFGGQNAS